MALDRERRPTIDTRGIASAADGVASAAGQLANASRMPNLPDELANGYKALGPAGAAIMGAGGVLGALAIKRKEAESIAQVAEAEAQVDAEEADFESWKMQNPDPATWEGEWQTRLTKIQGMAADEKLNNGAREKLGLLMTRYSGKSSVRVARDASTMTFQRAASATAGSIAASVEKGDFETARAKLNEGVSGGYFYGEKEQKYNSAINEAERQTLQKQAENLLMMGQVEEAKSVFKSPLFSETDRTNEVLKIDKTVVKGNQQGEFIQLADKAPDEALAKIEDPASFHLIEPAERVRLKDFAERKLDEYGRQEADAAEVAIMDLPPEKIKDAAVDNLGVSFKYASPEQKAIIRNKLAVKQGKAAINDRATFERAWTEVSNYDPSTDPKGFKAVYMEQNYDALFTESMRDELKGIMDKKRKKEPNAPTEATDLGPAMALIQESALSGGLIPIERPVMVDGKQVFDEPKKSGFVQTPGLIWGTNKKQIKENDGNPVPQTETDKVALARVSAVQGAIRKTLQSEVESGKLTDQDSILARSIELWKQKGGKIAPTAPTGPNPLLPSLGDMPQPSESADLNALLKKYGY